MKLLTKIDTKTGKFVPGKVYSKQQSSSNLYMYVRTNIEEYTLINLATGDRYVGPRSARAFDDEYRQQFNEIPTGTKLEFEV